MSAAVYPSKPPRTSDSRTTTTRSRNRSSSDPFADQLAARGHRAPDPPPKSSRMPAATATRPPRDNIYDAVRDTVTVNRDQTSRAKVPRSQTSIPPVPNSAPASGVRAPTSKARTQSQDSVTQAAATIERAKSKSGGRPKKGSQHADVIDRLDFTGVGPMFHHDGPFDACAPSRNRHRTKAPMLAWSSGGVPIDPLSAASNSDSPYPTADAYKNTFTTNYYEQPKKKVDAIAEAWGTHEPEPYEDFSAGGGSRPEGDTPTSSIYNGNGGSRQTNGKKPKDTRDPREVYKEYLDEGEQQIRRSGTNKRSTLPPPQPIFVPDANHPDLDSAPISPPIGSPGSGAPKRNKSLMQRIRKMRDSPNVPVAEYETGEYMSPSPHNLKASYSAPGGRPSHRTRDSFLGRFVGGTRKGDPKEIFYPTGENFDQTKDLPATPYGSGNTPTTAAEQDSLDYFADQGPSSRYGVTPGGGPGRTTSIMRRVKGVVRGGGK